MSAYQPWPHSMHSQSLHLACQSWLPIPYTQHLHLASHPWPPPIQCILSPYHASQPDVPCHVLSSPTLPWPLNHDPLSHLASTPTSWLSTEFLYPDPDPLAFTFTQLCFNPDPLPKPMYCQPPPHSLPHHPLPHHPDPASKPWPLPQSHIPLAFTPTQFLNPDPLPNPMYHQLPPLNLHPYPLAFTPTFWSSPLPLGLHPTP